MRYGSSSTVLSNLRKQPKNSKHKKKESERIPSFCLYDEVLFQGFSCMRDFMM